MGNNKIKRGWEFKKSLIKDFDYICQELDLPKGYVVESLLEEFVKKFKENEQKKE